MKAGPGPEVTEAEELERVVPAIEALAAAVRRALASTRGGPAVAAGRGRGRRGRRQRHQRLRRPRLPAGGRRRRAWPSWPPTSGWPPGCPTPSPCTDGLVPTVLAFLAERAARAEAAGIPAERIMVDAGLDLGKTEPQSLELLRASDQLAALGYPVFLSASNKRFLGVVLDLRRGGAAAGRTWPPTPSASRSGCRVLRAHDVRGGPAHRRRPGRGPGARAAAGEATDGERPPAAGRGRGACSARPSPSWSTSWSATATAP